MSGQPAWSCSCCKRCCNKIVELKQTIQILQDEIKTIDSQLTILTNNFDKIESIFKELQSNQKNATEEFNQRKKNTTKMIPKQIKSHKIVSNYSRSDKLQSAFDMIDEDKNEYATIKIDTQTLYTLDEPITEKDAMQSIESFLNANNDNTYVMIPKLDIHNKYTTSVDVLKVCKVDNNNNEGVSALNGQSSLQALIKIPKHTTIGQYIGNEWLETEFMDKYANDINYYKACCYAFDTQFLISKNEKSNKNKIITEDNKEQLRGVVIDPYFANNRPFVTYVNDCRENILSPNTTANDISRFNVHCVSAEIHGWPMIFMISTKDIQRGQMLWTFYGDKYHSLLSDLFN